MTTITREQALKIIEAADEVISALAGTNEDVHPGSDNMLRLWDDLNDRYAPPEVVRELARIALASLEREQIRHEHAKWSDSTFGCVGPIGPLKHLSKEALEAAAEPDDLSEWADMQFLLWDAQRRAGISDAEITAAMENKLKINMERQWPEPKDGEPRLHIKEPGNSPVTPDGWISCSEQMPDDDRIQFSVSLPAACGGDKYFIDGVFQPLRYERDCEKAVVAAGGVVNWVK